MEIVEGMCAQVENRILVCQPVASQFTDSYFGASPFRLIIIHAVVVKSSVVRVGKYYSYTYVNLVNVKRKRLETQPVSVSATRVGY